MNLIGEMLSYPFIVRALVGEWRFPSAPRFWA